MALIPKKQTNDNFVSILSSDASLRKVVSKEEFDAYLGTKEVRKFEDSTGKEGTKHEIIHEAITGKITKIEFVDTDYGSLLQVTVSDFPEDIVLSMSTSMPFAEDFMRKLPNIDLKEDVVIKPYSFVPEGKDKSLKGVTILQKGEKIANHFYDGKENCNGMPKPDGDTKKFSSDDWKIHFLQVRKFLINNTKEFASKAVFTAPVSPQVKVQDEVEALAHQMNASYPTEESINPEDIPFN